MGTGGIMLDKAHQACNTFLAHSGRKVSFSDRFCRPPTCHQED
jgi:hypothetical protein